MQDSPTQGVIVLHKKDNVATTIHDLSPTCCVVLADQRTFMVRDPIPAGHKLVLTDLPEKAEVIKYGEVIGITTQPVLVGQHVHTHNVQSLRGRAADGA
jgi:altronate dehydratase small subunit